MKLLSEYKVKTNRRERTENNNKSVKCYGQLFLCVKAIMLTQ